MRKLIPVTGALLATLAFGACGRDEAPTPAERLPLGGTPVAVTDTTIVDAFEASGTADPVRSATVATKLMGTVPRCWCTRAIAVRAGQLLVRIDARDLDAKEAQAAAGLAEADAVHHDAAVQAGASASSTPTAPPRRRSSTPAETGLARAEAGLAAGARPARPSWAPRAYADVRAPFAGVVTRRFVDPGAFAAPGMPLVDRGGRVAPPDRGHARADVARGLGAGQRSMPPSRVTPVTRDGRGRGPVAGGRRSTRSTPSSPTRAPAPERQRRHAPRSARDASRPPRAGRRRRP